MEYREFRASAEEIDGKLSGVAAPFGSETTIGDLSRGGWREEIAPGAFAKALRESDTVLLCDHDMSKPLARVSAGTLRLSETAKDLRFDADVVDTTYADDLMKNVRAKLKGGMSIGFQPVKDEWFDDAGNPSTRIHGTKRFIREVKLPEVSCVTNPAYKDTAVFARDDSAALLEERAAKASYADLETCGECGATGQYGSFCSGCGEPMSASKPAGAFCTSCGGAIDANSRDAHECAEGREAPEVTISGKDYTDMAAQLVKKYNELPEEDRAALRTALEAVRDDPDGKEYEAIDAALLQLKAGDATGAEKTLAANQATRSQEPDASTPETPDPDFALRDKEMFTAFRSSELRYAGL